jgi:2-polyprenyl-6-hydroxyphenyl methylase/3-demethylubiquinone-9 3-methyltransferase
MIERDQGSAVASDDARLRYEQSHWAREEDESRALDQYLRLGDKVYNRTKFKLVMALAGDVRGKTILDYGGGAGILAIPLAKAGAEVVLVDAEPNALKTARYYAAREGVANRVQAIEASTVPAVLRTRTFDIVIAKDIIEHIPEDEQFIQALSECQAPGGKLLLSTQSSMSLNYLLEGAYQKYWRGNRSWLGWDATHVRFYTPASLRRKLGLAGYDADRWAGVFIIPYNLPSWLLLGRAHIEWLALHYFDLTFGRIFPFNRFGWNVIVRATHR